MSDPVVPDAWRELLDGLDAERGAVMIVGGVDTGKTMLARWLVERLAERGPVAMADADVGQSLLGPPGTVGWGMGASEHEECVFVGVISPAHRPLGTATATWRACRRARDAGAAWLVLDTSGYVDGSGAVALKRAKVNLVRPTHVVLIEDESRRLPTIARAIGPGPCVHRLRPADAVEARSAAQRREYRRRRLANYLAEAEEQRVPLAGRAVYGGRPWLWGGSWGKLRESLRGMLVGLSDADGVCRAVGLLREVTDEGEVLHVLCPPVNADDIAEIGMGTVRLREDGTQIANDG